MGAKDDQIEVGYVDSKSIEGKLEPPAGTVADLNLTEHFKLQHLKTTITWDPLYPLSELKSLSVMVSSTIRDIKRKLELEDYSPKKRKEDAKLIIWSENCGSRRREEIKDPVTLRELAKKEKNWTKMCICFCNTGYGDAIYCHKTECVCDCCPGKCN